MCNLEEDRFGLKISDMVKQIISCKVVILKAFFLSQLSESEFIDL